MHLTSPQAAAGWRHGLRDALSLAAPFWRSQRSAWAQLAALVALTLAIVGINVRLSAWNSAFYDALQARDMQAFWHQLGIFGMLATAGIVLAVVQLVVQQRLVMRWRQGMTEHLLGQWLRPGTPYRLGAAAGAGLDNPDQRLADDVRSFATASLDLALGLLNAGVTLASFITILWGLSGGLRLPWPRPGWTLPGDMVWVAIAYAGIGSALVRRLGAPLVPTNAQQQRLEADFRFGLVQVREHAEAIALTGGEAAEQRRLMARFAAIRGNWNTLIHHTKRLTWFSAGYGQLAVVFPLIAATPRYFSGGIQLGGLMQTAQAFGQVQGALSWFINAYAGLAEWRATVLRLAAFRDALARDSAATPLALPAGPAAATAGTAPRQALVARHLQVAPPGAPALLRLPQLRLLPAEWVLLTGPSGSGKSAVLRTLAGLWPALAGEVRLPAGTMVLPQRPYLPLGTLADVLAYPQDAGQFDAQAMRQALQSAALETLADRLGETDVWAQRLSPGEQQRLQFARLFLHQPQWALLDEATSALDSANQGLVLLRLRRQLPRLAVLHLGHRAELPPLHDRVLQVAAGSITEATQAPRPRGLGHGR